MNIEEQYTVMKMIQICFLVKIYLNSIYIYIINIVINVEERNKAYGNPEIKALAAIRENILF